LASSSDFRALLLQIISGEISGEGKALFYDMILDERREEEFTKALKELGEEREDLYSGYDFRSEDWNQMKKSILKGDAVPAVLLKDRTIPDTIVKKMPVRRLSWIAAAASVVLLIGLGFYLKNSFRPKAEVVVNKPAINDAAPASNKAVLILSTGKKIILDSAKNGQLAKFGNTTISKTDSGKLLYSLSDNASSGSKINDDQTSFNTLTTPRGGIYELTLPDGTQAWLNAASRIDYPTRFTGKKREVFISGEVYFEVAHDAAHPFLVSLAAKTKDQGEKGHWMQIEVLGTHFNVNAYDDNGNPARTTLLEGSVKISAHGQNKIIKPGEQAITAFVSKTIDIDQNVNVDKIMAWRNGRIAITDVSVQQLMTEISRWYDVDIEYSGTVPDKQFYGSIRRDVPLSTVLHALEAYGVKTKIEGKKIIVQ
jgi:transmembrane sensor